MNPETEAAPTLSSTPAAAGKENGAELVIPADCIPNYDTLVIRDDTPVENMFAEKLYRLLTESLHSCWKPEPNRPFLAMANVGLFFALKQPPVVPDVMLSLGVRVEGDPSSKENNSYFMWKFGKPPDVVIELVSDRRGGEDSTKKQRYASIGVPYYVIFDPDKYLSEDILRSFGLHEGKYSPIPGNWFANVGLGVTLWESSYEDHPATWWLRWCDREGKLIPTGKELADLAQQRADLAQQRAECYAAKLRAAGIDPDA